MDISSLLSQVMDSRIASSLYSSMSKNELAQTQADRSRPDSTRLAFDSQMRSNSAMFTQSSQNMKDAISMVEVAQSGVTTIKTALNDMYTIVSEMESRDNLTEQDYAIYSEQLKTLSNYAASIGSSITWNGMSLLDGSAGMNSDGVVVLSGGGNPIDQVLTNMLNSDSKSVIGDDGSMNLSLLADQMTVTNDQGAKDLREQLETYITHVEGIESGYSYDVKSLQNLSTLYENNAEIFTNTIQYKNDNELSKDVTSSDILAQLLAAQSNGSIYSALS